MKLNKKILVPMLAIGLVCTTTIGAAAAADYLTSGKSNVSKGVIKYSDGAVLIDGNSVGYWMADNGITGLGTWGGTDNNVTLTISDGDIHASSNIDLYYAENCKDLVSKSKVQYSQAEGKVIVTFKKGTKANLSSKVKVVSAHITTPTEAN